MSSTSVLVHSSSQLLSVQVLSSFAATSLHAAVLNIHSSFLTSVSRIRYLVKRALQSIRKRTERRMPRFRSPRTFANGSMVTTKASRPSRLERTERSKECTSGISGEMDVLVESKYNQHLAGTVVRHPQWTANGLQISRASDQENGRLDRRHQSEVPQARYRQAKRKCRALRRVDSGSWSYPSSVCRKMGGREHCKQSTFSARGGRSRYFEVSV